jgi:transposase
LLPGVWIPPQEIRDLRAMVAQRRKMVRLSTIAKNRLHSALFRHHLAAPEGSEPFNPKHKEFWLSLPVSPLEQVNILCDWETVEFAERQKQILEEGIRKVAGQDERIPLLIQLPGIGMLSAITLLAAIGDIKRFDSPKRLVGYSGLGASVHASGQMYKTGRITKSGRKDIRYIMVEAAQRAVRCHPRWKAELARLEPRIGRQKAIVAIARKLLVAVWQVLTEETGDRFADEVQVARYIYAHAFDVGTKNLPDGMGPLHFTRYHLDRLGIGTKMTHLPWSGKRYKLPPSTKAG